MALDGDFSLVSLFRARNQMCLNWKSGKSCGHRFHASLILEVSETEPSGTSSSQEINFTINLTVRSSCALRPDPLPFRGIQNLHKLETSFFWGGIYLRYSARYGVGDVLLSLFCTPELRDDVSHPTSSPMNVLFQHQAPWLNRVV